MQPEEIQKQKNMDFSKQAKDISLLQEAELRILSGFCANPQRYSEMKKYYELKYQEHLIKQVETLFHIDTEKAREVVLGQKPVKTEADKQKLSKCQEKAKRLAHEDTTNKNINKAKVMAKAWMETLDE